MAPDSEQNNMKNKHTHIPYRHVVRSQCPTGTGDEGLGQRHDADLLTLVGFIPPDGSHNTPAIVNHPNTLRLHYARDLIYFTLLFVIYVFNNNYYCYLF